MRRRMFGSAIAVVLATMLVLVGCTSTSRRSGGSDDRLPTGTVDTTEPGFDPKQEFAEANELRDQLESAGIRCEGAASSPPSPEDGIAIGVVAQLYCPYDGGEIQITVYRTPEAKKAGIERLAWLACSGDWKADYVDGSVWVVGTVVDGRNESDPAMTDRISAALDAPVRTLAC